MHHLYRRGSVYNLTKRTMIFTKISHQEFSNGKEPLSVKDFLKHDLLHAIIDKELGIKNDTINSHANDIEMITGILHGVYEDSYNENQALLAAKNIFESNGQKVPQFFTIPFILRIKTQARKYWKQYQYLKTGEKLEIGNN